MAEVVSLGPVLSDSLYKTRPSSEVYYRSDANAGGNAVQQIEQHRRARQMKFPALSGRKEVESFRDPQNPSDIAFRKWNDEGDYRSTAPLRSCDNIIDPISGFVSIAGDVDRGTGHSRIHSMVDLPRTPQSYAPQELNSIRVNCPSAPPELQRASDRDPGTPYEWNKRQVLDGILRAKLGGWTSEKDPREKDAPRRPPSESIALRDKLALQYMYTSSTQRAYEDIPWDKTVPSRRWPPTTTLEPRADMVSRCFNAKRFDPAAQEWQSVGRAWDWFQTRKSHYKSNIPIPGTVFCSPLPRAGHIPNYSGCIGAENIEEIDNVKEPFNPFTVKRVPIPRPTETSHRPNIPRYSGCTRYRPDTVPAHSSQTTPELETTRREHRPMPVTPNTSSYKRESQMSRMVTTVPPCNPFNKIESDILKVEKVPNKQKKEEQHRVESP